MEIKKISSLFLALIVLAFLGWRCTKADATALGNDLIPAVDNVHTFADTINITDVTQALFNDTTRLGAANNYVIGNISNDPVFGKTNATLFLELKPTFFPYYFANKDSLTGAGTGLDSIVLTLSYKGFYGDTTIPQRLKVYELDPQTGNFSNGDSAFLLNFLPDRPYQSQAPVGEALVYQNQLGNFTFFSRTDSINNQIRIKLSDAFAQKIWNQDTAANVANKAFRSDSLYRTIFKGLAIVADQSSAGNGLFYVNLADAATRLEVHFRKKDKGTIDTTYALFPFAYSGSTNSSALSSSHANNIERDRTGSEIVNTAAHPEAIYLQTTPGNYAMLNIPQLSALSNRIVHRAEIIVEEIPDALSPNLVPPPYLYLDLKDSSTTERYKPIYYDLNPGNAYYPDNSTLFFPSSGIDYSTFGGYLRYKTDPQFGQLGYYTFNITRYVQHVITDHGYNYPLRLYAPYQLSYYGTFFNFNNNLAFGRIKIASGTNPNYKLRMRIVYSKI